MCNPLRISLLLCLLAVACGGRRGVPGGTGGVAVTGSGGRGNTGAGGAAGIGAACAGDADVRLVVADQRIVRLTMNEILNTVRSLIDETEAAALVGDGVIAGDDSVASQRRFPPLQDLLIAGDNFPKVDLIASHVASYVLAHFTTVTGCVSANDACATVYLDRLAARAYRRPLTLDERSRFNANYSKLRSSQTVNGYDVTFTVEEATSYAVEALLLSPQMLWRWEVGDPARATTFPAGIPLTDHELAAHLSFFLTDQPPGEALLTAASAGTLRTNLAAHVDALLASRTAQDWLRTIMETYLEVNQLPSVVVDPLRASDMGVETRLFLDNVLWNGTLNDMLLSRTAFLNTGLAVDVYKVSPPADATQTSFVRTTLPADERAGVLTNAGFLAAHGAADGRSLVPRGRFVAAALLCMPPDVDPGSASQPIAQQSSQEQVAYRAARPACAGCHSLFDPYGLALDGYDMLGRTRAVDEVGRPIDTHTTLAAALGGDAVANGVELAQALAMKPAFTNCMAKMLLQYALAGDDAAVEVPLPPQQAGCATANVVKNYQNINGKTFADLVRATVATPAFVLRRAAP